MKPITGHLALVASIALYAPLQAHGQAFSSKPLSVAVSNPTSLQFGPDDRLYVSEQYGLVHAFTVVRNADGGYVSTASETITLIRDIVNHDDDGADCSDDCARRQVTGLLVVGDAANPVLYVSSSDPRVAVASDTGLDTNSGMLTRLTCSGGMAAGRCQAWDRVDIVRGLPRSEENHATNGMDLDALTNTLYLTSGGNTNKGAASNSFSGTIEYFLSAAVLSVDLDAIAAIESAHGGAFVDTRSGTRFVYDLITLDDPTRTNIDKTHPGFSYPAGHPRRELTIDPGDPFGGNDGYNQALPEPNGPVQVHSPGYRNPYDVVVTAAGDLYTWDNGANSGWGGTPLLRDAAGVLKGYSTQPGVQFNPDAGDYCTNELNESGSATTSDGLHRIAAAGYYGGHASPIRAFPHASGLHRYEQQPDGTWLLVGPTLRLGDLLPAGYGVALTDYPNDPRQCEFKIPAGALEIINASTNGMDEYTADNFNGAMRGDLLAASFNGNLYRCKPDASGGLQDLPGAATGASIGRCEVLFGGFGSLPLDVTAQGSSAIFPGTIWAATYGANSIVVFEPVDFSCDPGNPVLDADGDGYSNGDEVDNGTNPCSAGSKPEDADSDNTSNLNDADDDNDGVPDVEDVFALDPGNGLTTPLPLNLPLFNNDPGTGLFGLGFTGLMLPRDGSTTWLQLFDPEQLAAGGAAGLLTVESVTAGTALGAANTQANGFLFGFDADATTPPFIVSTRLRPPWFGIGGAASTPQAGQSYGLMLGTGDQDNYLSVALAGDGSGAGQVNVTLEIAGVVSTTAYSAAAWGGTEILTASAIRFSILVDPQAGSARPQVSLDNGASIHLLGPALPIPAAWLSATDARGLASGAISTHGAIASSYGATWDDFTVEYTAGTGAGAWSRVDDFDQVRHEAGFVQAGRDFHLIGGRESEQVRSYDPTSAVWRVGAASPIKLHHFQAVELDGLIYAVGAMIGDCCAEPESPNVYIYDPLANRWITGPPIPAARLRGGGGAVAVGGKIYLVSGNTNGHYGPVSALVDVYDPATGRFAPLSPIPHPRDHFFVAHHEGSLYAVAGRNSNAGEDGDVFDDSVPEVDVYDIAGNQWSTLPAGANLPTPRAAAPTGIIGNELIVAGGESGIQATAHGETEAFDLARHTWRTLSPMRTARHATQAIVSNHGLYVAAGSSQRGGPGSTPLDLEALHLYGGTVPDGSAIVAGVLQTTAGLDFGRVASGATVVQSIRLTHTDGDQAVVIDALALSGHADFRLVAAPSLPFVVAPGATIELQVEFAPQAQGVRTAAVELRSPGRPSLHTALSGEGFGSTSATVLFRINVGGPPVNALEASGMNWAADTAAAPSAYRVDGGTELFNDAESGAYPGPVITGDPSLPADVPPAVFQSERWDPLDAPEMHWSFPVASGSLVEVRLFFAELYSSIDAAGERVFDVRLEGAIPAAFNDIDRFAEAGVKGAIMRSALATASDGSVDLEFLHVAENPALNAIEIRLIAADNAPPDVVAPVSQTHSEGEVVTVQIVATDDDNDALTYAASGLPTGLSIDAGSGLITGVVAAGAANGSPYAPTITVSDGTDTSTVTFSWSITAVDASGSIFADGFESAP